MSGSCGLDHLRRTARVKAAPVVAEAARAKHPAERKKFGKPVEIGLSRVTLRIDGFDHFVEQFAHDPRRIAVSVVPKGIGKARSVVVDGLHQKPAFVIWSGCQGCTEGGNYLPQRFARTHADPPPSKS
jgi:hypothetical protein